MDLSLLSIEVLLPFILVGFAAQLVDGALGMAFGIISNTLLVAVMGVPPALASQRVHVVECFTTATSGISHLLHGNVDRRLFLRLLLPGMIGGVLGAYVLTSLDAAVVKPFVLLYLSGVGLYLLYSGFRQGEARGSGRRSQAAPPRLGHRRPRSQAAPQPQARPRAPAGTPAQALVKGASGRRMPAAVLRASAGARRNRAVPAP